MLPILTEAIDVGTLLAPAGTGATDTIASIMPVAIPVFVVLSGITIALRVFGKFGVKR